MRYILPLLLLLLLPITLQAQPDATMEDVLLEVMPSGINSSGIEIVPVISTDGKRLYFDRKYDSANVGGTDDEDDIYVAVQDSNGVWGAAAHLALPLNTPGSDVLFWISPDGDIALVHNGELARRGGTGLGIAHRVGGVWTAPRAISIEGWDDLGDTYYATITPDLRRLIVALPAKMAGQGAGDSAVPVNDNLDLYYAPTTSADLLHWGHPVALSMINTSSFEGAPFVAADNRTLYFASEGYGGFGGSDIYMTRRIGTGWGEWTKPVNLGPQVNTAGFEASISIPADGSWAYISGIGPFGRTDILRIQLPKTLRPEPVIVVRGRLLMNGRGITGLVRALRADRSEAASVTSGQDGSFVMYLAPKTIYRLIGWASEKPDITAVAQADAGAMESGELSVIIMLGDVAPGE